jgi:tRNA pseudouridine55 synthase
MDGIFLIDKQIDETSFKTVDSVKKKLKLNKIGHTGTLDPFATGLLIACVNRATKLVSLFQDLPKVYEAVFVFGEKRDTDDVTGQTVETSDTTPTLEEIERAVPSFRGLIEQLPPQYSALKVQGKRAYELARKGEEVKLRTRKVTIYNYEILGYDQPELSVRITCSSGTYIRSLARDLGEKLGTLGYVKKLIRTAIEPFSVAQAKKKDEITHDDLIPLKNSLHFLPSLTVKQEWEERVRNGIPFRPEMAGAVPVEKTALPYRLLLDGEGDVLAVLDGKKYLYINTTRKR